MPRTVAVIVEIHLLDVETGLWCPHCLLPSVIAVHLAGVNPTTLQIVMRWTSIYCDDCGANLP
jgi:hypothetical protein